MIAQSPALRSMHWAIVQGDPLERLRAQAACASHVFSLQDRKYELRLRTDGARDVRFEWRALDDRLLPPLFGTVHLSRFGRLTVAALRATYWFEEDPASKLLHDAVGAGPAHQMLSRAGLAVISLLRARRAAGVHDVATETKQKRHSL